MYASSDSDPADLIAARVEIDRLIGKWLEVSADESEDSNVPDDTEDSEKPDGSEDDNNSSVTYCYSSYVMGLVAVIMFYLQK